MDHEKIIEFLDKRRLELKSLVHADGCPNIEICPEDCGCNDENLSTRTACIRVSVDYISIVRSEIYCAMKYNNKINLAEIMRAYHCLYALHSALNIHDSDITPIYRGIISYILHHVIIPLQEAEIHEINV